MLRGDGQIVTQCQI